MTGQDLLGTLGHSPTSGAAVVKKLNFKALFCHETRWKNAITKCISAQISPNSFLIFNFVFFSCILFKIFYGFLNWTKKRRFFCQIWFFIFLTYIRNINTNWIVIHEQLYWSAFCWNEMKMKFKILNKQYLIVILFL